MNISNEKIKEKLHEKGYKFTQQRQDIFQIMLENNEKHLSCDDIFEIVRKDNKDIGIATIYRTLQLFEKINIVDKVDFNDGYSRYELNLDPDNNNNHHHMICLECGKILEVKLDLLETLEKEIEKSEEFKIVEHNVKFYGYCSDCQTKSL